METHVLMYVLINVFVLNQVYIIPVNKNVRRKGACELDVHAFFEQIPMSTWRYFHVSWNKRSGEDPNHLIIYDLEVSESTSFPLIWSACQLSVDEINFGFTSQIIRGPKTRTPATIPSLRCMLLYTSW